MSMILFINSSYYNYETLNTKNYNTTIDLIEDKE